MWAALVTTCTPEKSLYPKHTATDYFGEENSTAFHNGFLQGVGLWTVLLIALYF